MPQTHCTSAGPHFTAHTLDPVFAESPTGGFANNGVTPLLEDRDGYLVMERSFVTGVGNSIRIYRMDTRDATDVQDEPSLQGQDVRPVRKELLVDLADESTDPQEILMLDEALRRLESEDPVAASTACET